VDTSRLERVLDPAYVDDLEELPMEELRERRAECQELEVGLSYARRLAQGRLDIIGAELRRRTEGGDAIDVHALVEQLPEILSDRVRGPGLGRLPSLMVPGEGADFSGELDEVVDAGNLAGLADHSDSEITAMLDALQDYEQSVSARRRALHERLDALQAEITRRYRTGEASVETLLQ
jgi:hypothetical protein